MSPAKILLTGATGYVGGSVLHHLVASATPAIKDATITVLVRGEDRARQLEEAYGNRVRCVQFRDWNDVDLLSEVASQHDIVINAGSGFHPPSAEALVRGLAKRQHTAPASSPAWMLHTSGCSNISDKPLTGEARPNVEWDDAEAEKIYEFEKAQEAIAPYPQRTSELLALDTGIESGVRVLSVNAPCIFGTGSGLFQKAGLMIPIMTAYVLDRGYAFSVGDGTGAMDYVHVSDLADVYVLFVEHILRNGGEDLPRGKEGIVYPSAGRVLIRDIARGCVDAAFAQGALPREGSPKTPEVRTVDLAEAATTTAGNATVAEAGWAGHRLTKGTVARRLGWNPTRLEEAWKQDFVDELVAAQKGERAVTIDNCMAEKQS